MSKEEIKEEFLKSYNCSSMKEFKHTKLTSEKFYEIMEDYFAKCSYNQKYKEVIDKAIDKLYCWGEALRSDFQKEMLDILKEVK